MENWQDLSLTLIKHYGFNLLCIAALFFIGKILLKKLVFKIAGLTDGKTQKRAQTLASLIVTIGNVVIYVIVILMLLAVFGVNLTPILAGAGIIGLGIGFGTQSLIKDFVSGLFILIENQYNIGDRVKIGAFEGKVIKITMRSTILQDDQGGIYYLQNGSIQNVVNFSQKSGSP